MIIVEAKADDFNAACEEVEFYVKENSVGKDIIAIAISGQTESAYKSALFINLSSG